MKAKKIVRSVLGTLAALLILAVWIIGGYVAYVALQYYRIDDMTQLKTNGAADICVRFDETYSVMSYNLGFGAYSPEYTFFMDTGVMNNGKKVEGKYAKGISKSDVEKNVRGQLEVAKHEDADFYFFQEADKKAHRSYKTDMCSRATDVFENYMSTYAQNFHTAYLLYPLSDPIGKTDAGLLTFSRYRIDAAVRRSFPITKAFIDKLFDLDRCFAVHYLPIEGSEKKLVLINLHMSAYDRGGTVRAKQLTMLNGVLKEERDKGNYVIAGGDFNHCLIADEFASDEEALQYFKSEQKTPDWVKNSILHKSEIADGYEIEASINAATCRGADIPYREGVNFSTVIDGFLVSDNIEVENECTVDTKYAYSDHNPVSMRFRLKSRTTSVGKEYAL